MSRIISVKFNILALIFFIVLGDICLLQRTVCSKQVMLQWFLEILVVNNMRVAQQTSRALQNRFST